MKDLAALASADFEALIGQDIMVHGAPLTVAAVDVHKPIPGFDRTPFSVILKGEALESGSGFSDVVAVHHDTIGEHQLLVNRIIEPDQTPHFEIVFG